MTRPGGGSNVSNGTVVDVVDRLAEVRARIEAAGRAPDDVVVVAVTKGFGVDAVEAATAAGLVDVGENYAQELAGKVDETPANAERRWHFLGGIQRNKVRIIAAAVHLWQGVDRVSAGEEIARRAPGAKVLVQVRITEDDARNGCDPDGVPELVERLDHLGLDVRGLMAVGPAGPPELARPGFRTVSALADRLGLAERSMGMTDDLGIAVEEGSTMVRVGRGLFGARPGAPKLRR
ncbi:MAG TPA: YggS family pyridoxal phosphate-dependent enzyme [Acidimicrobiales bacterium]|nr:YggS family pyridoxal phosphate-dependent enzyme [Acidimicrobiales bacterium]